LKNGNRIYLIGQGRLVNLAAAEGHPPSVMDMSFATQALATEYCIQNKGKLAAKVYNVPVEVEQYVARHKLASMGITIDELSEAQKQYMTGWEQGT
jgi:adenosylhomocysteinase